MRVTLSNSNNVYKELNIAMSGDTTKRQLRRMFDRIAPMGYLRLMIGSGETLTRTRWTQLKDMVDRRLELIAGMVSFDALEQGVLEKDAQNFQR